jgi:hypothetical protein
MSSSSGGGGGPPRALATRLSRAFLGCGAEAAVYGQCIAAVVASSTGGGVEKAACDAEFRKLKQCSERQLKTMGRK